MILTMIMRIFFFGDDYTDDFEDPTDKPLKDWDDKHLPFVGWTFTRFEMKDKPSSISIFQAGEVNIASSGTTTSESEEKKSKKEKSKMTVWGKKDKEKYEKDTKSKDKKKSN